MNIFANFFKYITNIKLNEILDLKEQLIELTKPILYIFMLLGNLIMLFSKISIDIFKAIF